MNTKYILLSSLFWCGLALDEPGHAKILDYQLENSGAGPYYFRFESSDGIVREEEGAVLDENVPDSPIIVKGSYSYSDETGRVYTVRYIADENGFHPEGDHISVPSYVIDSRPNEKPLLVSPSPRPPVPVQFVQTTPRPHFIPGSPTRFQANPFSSTARPEISTTPTRIPIPLDVSSTGSNRIVGAKPISFNELDTKLQNSIVNILSNGDGRGFNVAAVNSI